MVTVQDAVQDTSKDDEESRKASQVLAFGEGLTTGSVGKLVDCCFILIPSL